MISSLKRVTLVLLCICFLFLMGCSSDQADFSQKNGGLSDGEYSVFVNLEGGTGKAKVTSPTTLTVKDGQMTAQVEWSSSHYDYMIVGEEKYLPINTEGNSMFEIPVEVLDSPMDVIADTTAMSTAHEIEYTLTFSLEEGNEEEEEAQEQSSVDFQKKEAGAISKELIYDHSMELKYANQFSVDYYQDGYALIQIEGDGAFLVVPEGKEAPSDLDSEVHIISQPLNHIYLVASAVMDMFRSVDALDQVRFTGTKKENWHIDEVVEAIDRGDILYAGKYSAPDYEKIMAEECNLVIENTMIYHTPSVKEQLERFGITVMVDHSSYEQEPLGRMEWVKLYALLCGKEDAAEKVFEEQISKFQSLEGQEGAQGSVAFFYFANDGQVNVRKSSDYLPKMIQMAGGTYIFDDLGDDSTGGSSTVSLSMEEFYARAKDADYMVYNSTTVGEVESLDDLLNKNPLLAKCKAVENKKVFCTSNNLYQSSMELGTIIGDFQKMLQGNMDGFTYLHYLE